MEILVVFLVAGMLLLWSRQSSQGARLQEAEALTHWLQRELVALRGEVADLATAARREAQAPRSAATGAERPETWAAPVVAPSPPADVAAPAAPVVPAPIPAAPAHALQGPALAASPWTPADRTPADARRRVRAAREHLADPRSGVSGAVPETPTPVSRERGPSLFQRLLTRLGMVPEAGAEGWTRAAVEAWLEGRLLAVVGGIALLLGAIFFLSLAISRNLITHEMQVAIALVAGGGLLVLGELAFAKVRGIVGHVLVAVGLAIVSLALLAATRLYGIVPVEWGLLGALVAAVAAALIAVRHDSQLVAAFGLIAVLASPPLLGASPTLVTLLFVAVTLIGTTGIALFRTWAWLPPLAFVLAAPQLASYVAGGPPIVDGLVAIAGFWLVNTIAAGGEETRHRSDRLRTTTVTLLLAAAAFTLWAGFTILSGDLERWRGTFLLVLAVAHLALALVFLVRFGDRHPFGLVVAASGLAALTMAAPVQFGGPPVAIAWAAEAVALTGVAVLRRHSYSAAVALVLGALALGHLVAFEYPPASLVTGYRHGIPFVAPEGMMFGFMIAGLAVAALLVRVTWIRAALAVVGGAVALYVFPFEVSGASLVTDWGALAVVGTVAYARVVSPALRAEPERDATGFLALPEVVGRPISEAIEAVRRLVGPAWLTVTALAWIGTYAHVPAFDYPVPDIGRAVPPALPVLGEPAVSFGLVILALVVTGALVAATWLRLWLGALGVLLTLYVLPFELSDEVLVSAWAVVVGATWVVEARVIAPRIADHLVGPPVVRHARAALRTVAGLGFAVAVGHTLALDFGARWIVRSPISTLPYVGPEAVALVALLAALGVRAWAYRDRWARIGAAGIALTLLVVTVGTEVPQPHVTIAWGVLAVVSVLLARRLGHVDVLARTYRPFAPFASERMPLVAAAIGVLAIFVRGSTLADPLAFGRAVIGAPLSGAPFVDERTYVLLVLTTTLVACGWSWSGTKPLLRAGVVAALVIAWLLPFEVRPGYAVAGWSLVGLGAAWLVRLVPSERTLLGSTAIGFAAAGLAVALGVVAPLDRLIVDAETRVLGWPLLTDATVALASLAIAIGVAAILHRGDRLALPAIAVAGAVAVYLLSVGVVDVFQREVASRPAEDLEGLQKSAQVGLSVLWSALGGIGFATGLRLHRTPVRLFGLALLGLATVKVFLVDLAALDVVYRVLSLVVLGVLLLGSALVYARMQHPHGPTPTHA